MSKKPGKNDRKPNEVRPRVGGYVQRDHSPGFRNSLVRRVARLGSTLSRVGGGGKGSASSRRAHWDPRGRKAAFVLPASVLSRRVVVKGRYQELNDYGRKAARLHLDYIQRDGVEKDGSPGMLYNASGAAEPVGFQEPLEGEKRQYRFILSPEDGGELDLTEFTKRLVSQMEKDLGRDLLWAAVNHYNTEQPHTHLVVRGVDKAGKELFIDGDYLANGIRNRARELATEELGLRTQEDLDRQLTKELGQERFTSIDRQLLDRAKDSVLDLREYPSAPRERRERTRFLGRIATLEKLGLARCLGGAKWTLAAGWDDTLKALGQRGDIIKRLHAAGGSDPARYRALADRTPGSDPIEGIVRHKGLHDELRGTLFAAVETPGGDLYYIPVPGRLAESVRVGDIVRASVEGETWLKPADARLVELAASQGGLYNPGVHRKSIPNDVLNVQTTKGVKPVPADEFVQAHVKRLNRLANVGVGVRRLEGGRWEVPPDLERRLARLDLEMPQTRTNLRVLSSLALDDQVAIRGPSWLDGLSAEQASAPQGFGAEVREAMKRRAAAVEDLGVSPADPYKVSKLRQLEREDLGRALAEHRRFVRGIPKGATFDGIAEPRILSSGQRVTVVRSQDAVMVIPTRRGGSVSPDGPVRVVRGEDAAYSVEKTSDLKATPEAPTLPPGAARSGPRRGH